MRLHREGTQPGWQALSAQEADWTSSRSGDEAATTSASFKSNQRDEGSAGKGLTGQPGGLGRSVALARNVAGGGAKKEDALQVMISTTTADGPERILDWAQYHRLMGVDHFFMFVEGKAATPEAVEKLRKFPGMKVWEPSDELNTSRNGSRIWNERWLGNFFNKPCNNELFVRQSLNMEIAIATAHKMKINWHIHIDTDELLHPGGHGRLSVKTLLYNIPEDVDTLVFPNYEACPETDSVKDPFREVTLFKRNFDHVVRDVYKANYKDVTGTNPNYFLTYANGKSAARVQAGLRPNGAHRFHNYGKQPREMKASEAAVLHYTYNTFDDILSRKSRCKCGLDEASLKKCFILDFDAMVYKLWDEMSETQMRKFYNDQVVYRNKALKAKLLANGLFSRMYTPQILMEGIDDANAVLRANDGTRDASSSSSAVSLSSSSSSSLSSSWLSSDEEVVGGSGGEDASSGAVHNAAMHSGDGVVNVPGDDDN